MNGFGKLGRDVGVVGRWIRLILGIFTVLFVMTDFYPVTHTHSLSSYVWILVSLLAITGVFTLGHVLFGNSLHDRSPIWGTLIFVVPVMFLIVAPMINPALQVGHWIGQPFLNHPFRLALLLYIGISFLFQWKDQYGGCEVVTIPNFIFRKDYGSYCVPLLPLDIAEKAIMDRVATTPKKD